MTLEQLRLFVAVAEREHVTRAAAALHRTQSAVSAAIAGLEQQSGVILFHRVGRRIVLTEEGRQFLAEARAVLAQADAAERALADLAGTEARHSFRDGQPDHRQLLAAAQAGGVSRPPSASGW